MRGRRRGRGGKRRGQGKRREQKREVRGTSFGQGQLTFIETSIICKSSHAQFDNVAILIVTLLAEGRVVASLPNFWWHWMAEG